MYYYVGLANVAVHAMTLLAIIPIISMYNPIITVLIHIH